jgi:hypothetical protein
MERIIELIIENIDEIEREYQLNKAMILTEDDLKCHLFRKLYDIYDEDLPTMDAGITASPVHSEVTYYNSKGVLYYRPDLAIIDTESLSILHSIEYDLRSNCAKFKKIPTKEFQFGGNSIIFELKFCRNKSRINKRHIHTYIKDIEKIKAIQKLNYEKSNGQNKIFGFFIVFNKTDKYDSSFPKMLEMETDYLKIIYKTGNIEFPSAM